MTRVDTSPASEQSLVGVVIDGRYTIERPLASGGMGSVYLARQRNLARPVAVKIVSSSDAELLERFRREAESLGQVSHPAIVEVHDFVQEPEPPGRCFLVMSYVEGQDLADYLEGQPGGAVSEREAVDLVLPIASALVELHASGIVHRDIKPANIIRFQGADGRPAVKLVDFGIARRSVDTSLTSAGFIVGTPPYMAPETLMAKPHTPVADVYALGATLLELLTGQPPFGTGRLHEIMARALRDPVRLPPALAERRLGRLLQAMLAREEAGRPNALQVVEELERVRDELAARRVRPSQEGLATLAPAPGDGVGPEAMPLPATARTKPALGGERSAPTDLDRRLLSSAPTALALASTSRPAPGVSPGTTQGAARRSGADGSGVVAGSDRGRRLGLWVAGGLVLVGLLVFVVWAFSLPSGSKSKGEASADGGASPPHEPSGLGAGSDRRSAQPAALRRRRQGAAPREGARRAESLGAQAAALARACTSPEVAKRYFAQGKTAARQRRSRRALVYYHAVLQCAYASNGQRRWAAYLASNHYRIRGACAAARRLWRTYRNLSRLARKPYKPFAGCP